MVPRCVLLTCALLLLHEEVGLAAPPTAVPEQDPFSPRRLESRGPRPPWPRRKRPVEKIKPSAHGLVDLGRWPAEPPSPTTVDAGRFAAALKELCGGWWPPKRPLQYATWMLEHARAFRVDPFLLAGLIYRQSRCIPEEKTDFGVGLAQIDPAMHGGFLRKGRYQYFVLEKGRWQNRELELGKFSMANVRRAEASIYLTAGLLAMAREQCPGVDGAFGSVPHRHFVSHVIWGDRVRGAGAEDRVLNARRRLIEYYIGQPAPARGKQGEVALRCPLDGAPRVVSSAMGSDREDGKRLHKGIDLASTWGEPVRAVADGQVVLAGVDRPSGGPVNLTPEEASAVKGSQMGAGGLFVMVLHQGGLRSAYMHLSSYVVKANDKVKAGDLLGRVGKSGSKESGAHLHFELRQAGQHIDPLPALAPDLIPPDETWLGRKLLAEEQRVRRKRRVIRWRARQAETETSAKAARP